MNRKNIFGKKMLALLTTLAVLLSIAPVTVSALSGAQGGEIIVFGLYEAAITVPPGTAEADLPLPSTLAATVRLPAGGVEAGEPDAPLEAEADVPVTWASADYDGATTGTPGTDDGGIITINGGTVIVKGGSEGAGNGGDILIHGENTKISATSTNSTGVSDDIGHGVDADHEGNIFIAVGQVVQRNSATA